MNTEGTDVIFSIIHVIFFNYNFGCPCGLNRNKSQVALSSTVNNFYAKIIDDESITNTLTLFDKLSASTNIGVNGL
jgi:hypothetical protein